MHDNLRAAIVVGKLGGGVGARPIVGVKFLRKFRQPLGAGFVKVAAGLADPANLEFARWVDVQEKILANGMRQQESSWMSGALEAFVVTGMKNSQVIQYSRPADAKFSKRLFMGIKTCRRNFIPSSPHCNMRDRQY